MTTELRVPFYPVPRAMTKKELARELGKVKINNRGEKEELEARFLNHLIEDARKKKINPLNMDDRQPEKYSQLCHLAFQEWCRLGVTNAKTDGERIYQLLEPLVAGDKPALIKIACGRAAEVGGEIGKIAKTGTDVQRVLMRWLAAYTMTMIASHDLAGGERSELIQDSIFIHSLVTGVMPVPAELCEKPAVKNAIPERIYVTEIRHGPSSMPFR